MILPGVVGVASILTPIATIGLGIIMIGAARIHFRLKEPKNVATNFVLLSLCVFVVIGRL